MGDVDKRKKKGRPSVGFVDVDRLDRGEGEGRGGGGGGAGGAGGGRGGGGGAASAAASASGKGEIEGEMEGEGAVDPDEPVYCSCRRVSFGKMVACEDPDCLIEWFHFGCVGLVEEVSI